MEILEFYDKVFLPDNKRYIPELGITVDASRLGYHIKDKLGLTITDWVFKNTGYIRKCPHCSKELPYTGVPDFRLYAESKFCSPFCVSNYTVDRYTDEDRKRLSDKAKEQWRTGSLNYENTIKPMLEEGAIAYKDGRYDRAHQLTSDRTTQMHKDGVYGDISKRMQDHWRTGNTVSQKLGVFNHFNRGQQAKFYLTVVAEKFVKYGICGEKSTRPLDLGNCRVSIIMDPETAISLESRIDSVQRDRPDVKFRGSTELFYPRDLNLMYKTISASSDLIHESEMNQLCEVITNLIKEFSNENSNN